MNSETTRLVPLTQHERDQLSYLLDLDDCDCTFCVVIRPIVAAYDDAPTNNVAAPRAALRAVVGAMTSGVTADDDDIAACLRALERNHV